jgi:hypothetical protein
MLLRKTESNQYCSNEPLTNSTVAQVTTARGGAAAWRRVTVPISAFGCDAAGLSLDQVDQFDWQNQIGQQNPERNAIVCIGDVTIVR